MKETLSLILAQASASEHGVRVFTNDVERLRTRLYNIRRNQPEYQDLSFSPDPQSPTTHLWIIKRHE